MHAHTQAPRRPIAELRPDVPEAVAAVVNRMLAKNADERYTSPAEVAAALQPFVEGCDLAEFVRTARRTTTSRLDLSQVGSSRPSSPKPDVVPPSRSCRRMLYVGSGVILSALMIAALCQRY